MYKFFLIFSLLFSANLFAEELDSNEVEVEEDFSEYQQTFLLPLDVSDEPEYALSVSIPEGFVAVQPISQFGIPESMMIEYIPEDEDLEKWTEMITVNKFIGKKIQAIQFSHVLKDHLLASSKEGKILVNKASKDGSIEQSYFVIQYMNGDKQEILGYSFFSGPYDFAGAQYTIRLDDDETIPDATDKIEQFFENNVSIVVSD